MSEDDSISTSVEALADQWDVRESVVEQAAHQTEKVEIFLGAVETSERGLRNLRDAINNSIPA